MPDEKESPSAEVFDLARRFFEGDRKGRCASCGLAGKQMLHQEGIRTLSEYERNTGALIGTAESNGPHFPVCVAGHSIYEEALWASADNPQTGEKGKGIYTASSETLLRDRKCTDWEQANLHFTPQWHLEQRRMRDLTQMQIDNANKLAEMQAANALKMAEVDRAIYEERTKIAAEHAKTSEALVQLQKRSDKETGRFNKLFTALALAALVLSIGQIGYPDGLAGIHFPAAREEAPAANLVVTPVSTPESR